MIFFDSLVLIKQSLFTWISSQRTTCTFRCRFYFARYNDDCGMTFRNVLLSPRDLHEYPAWDGWSWKISITYIAVRRGIMITSCPDMVNTMNNNYVVLHHMNEKWCFKTWLRPIFLLVLLHLIICICGTGGCFGFASLKMFFRRLLTAKSSGSNITPYDVNFRRLTTDTLLSPFSFYIASAWKHVSFTWAAVKC